MATNERDMRELIRDAMTEYESNMLYTSEFEDAGVMTNDVGFVVKMQDDSEFQVTIKQSK